MKFAEKLDANKYRDWPYIEYRALKKLLKDLKKMSSKPSTPKPDASGGGKFGQLSKSLSKSALATPLLEDGRDSRDLFLEKLREQRDAVQAFFDAEIERCGEQLQLLLAQMEQLFTPSPSGDPGSSSSPDERSESSLVRASTDLYRQLQQLRNYAILNYTGLLKLAKKYDKKNSKLGKGDGKALTLLGDWSDELKTSASLSPDALDLVIEQLEQSFARVFCDGSVQVARATLLVRKERPNSAVMITLGVRLGVIVTLLFWLLWDGLVDVRIMDLSMKLNRDRLWIATQLPLCRAALSIVFGQFLWAGCLYVMNRARINYEFMLDLSPRTTTNATLVASAAARTLIFCLLALLLFTKALIGELPRYIIPGVFPVAMVVVTVGSLLTPPYSYGTFQQFFSGLAAPLQPVDLVSVLVADVLTSLVKPLQDFAYAACYIGTREFLLPYNAQGACHSSTFRQDVIVPLLCAVPLWCRFMQCLRLFHDSQKRFPALPNALKYSVSLLMVLFGEVHPSLVSAGFADEDVVRQWVHYTWITIYMIATLYTFGWDVCMDWRLGQADKGGLRERRMFAYRSVYYSAIVVDFVLRFAWTATLVPHWFRFASNNMLNQISSVWVLPVVMLGEMFRRAMWLVLRLESEHLHNTEGFRRVDVVPLHFDHGAHEKESARSAQASKDEAKSSRRVEILIELLVYAAVVAILATAAVSDYIDSDVGKHAGAEPAPPSPPLKLMFDADDGRL